MALVIYALPVVVSAWLGWLVLSFLLPWPVRRAGLLLIFIAVGVGCSLLRIDGMDGEFRRQVQLAVDPHARTEASCGIEIQAGGSRPANQPPARPLPRSANSRATGPVSAGRDATTVCWACGSRPIGGNRRRRNCGGIASVPAGRRSPWSATGSSRRSSGATTSMSSATTRRRAAEVWTHHDATRFSEMVGGPWSAGHAHVSRRAAVCLRGQRAF